MLPKLLIKKLNTQADIIKQMTRGLNMNCSNLNGVAAVIPDDAPHPASYFKGYKVILHNVSYDPDTGAIGATITMPYTKDIGETRRYSGGNYRYYIDETWFE